MSQIRRLQASRWLCPLLGLGLTAALALGAWLAWKHESSGGWLRLSSPLPAASLAAEKTLGVNTNLDQYDADSREEMLAAMEATGLSWLRLRFLWEAIEPERGQWNWAVADALVDDAVRHHLKIIAVLDGSPAWARAPENVTRAKSLPKENRDYGTFVAAFAARYGDRIDYYQVWDEPNIEARPGDGSIAPSPYVGLLREAAVQLRASDPGAVVLLAALAPNTEPGPANLSELSFLDAVYQQGGAEWFDVLAAQPYCFDEAIGASPDLNRLNWNRTLLLRNVMLSHGDAGTAVWAVSAGCLAPEGGRVDGDLTTAMRSAILVVRQDWPWMGPILWAAWTPSDRLGQYAVWAPGVPDAGAVRAPHSLAMAATVAYPGAYAADHPTGQYVGDWRVSPSGADIGASGDRLIVPFWGTRIDLVVRRGTFQAFLFVKVDGKPANALPRDRDGQAYVVLYDAVPEDGSITLARGLSPDLHTVEIVAERGWGQWAILGWVVWREARRSFPWFPLILLVAAMSLLFVTLRNLWLERRELIKRVRVLLVRSRGLSAPLAFAILVDAALAVYVVPGSVLSLCALTVLAALLILRPEMGLALIALFLPTRNAGKPLLGKTFSAVEILTLLTAVAYLVNWLLRPKEAGFGRGAGPGESIPAGLHASRRSAAGGHLPRLSQLDWAVIALVVVGAASLLWAEHGRVAAREYRTVVFEASLYYGLLRLGVRDKRVVWLVADAWVLGAMILAALGLASWVFGFKLITAEGVRRVGGFGGSPNNVALYLGRVFPLAVVVGVCGQAGRRRWAYAGAAILMGIAIILTYSRGSWLLGIPAAFLFLVALRGRRRLALAVGAVLIVAVVVVLIAGPTRLRSLLDAEEGTSFLRVQLWQSSWAMIRDHPVLGVGLDNFLYAYRTHYVLPTAWEEFNLSHPHNLLLDFWLRLGLPGLGVLFWLLVSFFRRGGHAYRVLRDDETRLLVLGLMASVVYFVAHGLVDNAFFLVDLGFAFMLVLALVQIPLDLSLLSNDITAEGRAEGGARDRPRQPEPTMPGAGSR